MELLINATALPLTFSMDRGSPSTPSLCKFIFENLKQRNISSLKNVISSYINCYNPPRIELHSFDGSYGYNIVFMKQNEQSLMSPLFPYEENSIFTHALIAEIHPSLLKLIGQCTNANLFFNDGLIICNIIYHDSEKIIDYDPTLLRFTSETVSASMDLFSISNPLLNNFETFLEFESIALQLHYPNIHSHASFMELLIHQKKSIRIFLKKKCNELFKLEFCNKEPRDPFSLSIVGKKLQINPENLPPKLISSGFPMPIDVSQMLIQKAANSKEEKIN